MRVNIRCKPSYSAAFCVLDQGETLYAQPGSMLAMGGSMRCRTGTGGSIGRSFLRGAFGGEHYVVSRYDAQDQDAWVALAPPYPGDVEVVELEAGDAWMVEPGSLLASTGAIDPTVGFAGLRKMLLHEGLTLLLVEGPGTILLSSYGGVVGFDIGDGESMTIDTGHLVGHTYGMQLELGLHGGPVTSMISQEGIVGKLHGPGRVLLQTRSEQQLHGWLRPDQAEQGNR